MTRKAFETPSFYEIIDDIVDDKLFDLNIAMPATVVSVDAKKRRVSVQPSFRRVFVNIPEPVDIPVIQDVPLAEIRANDALISMPIAKGDHVLLIFSQRDLTDWKKTGGRDVPATSRRNHLSDAIALPCLYPSDHAIDVDPNALVVRYGGSRISLKKSESLKLEAVNAKLDMTKDGKFYVGNGTVELLDLLNQTLTQIQNTLDGILALTVLAPSGTTSTPINSATFTAIKSNVSSIATLLGKIKS